MSKSVILEGSFAALLVAGVLIWYSSNYLMKLYCLIKLIFIFNNPSQFGYEKFFGTIMPIENTPIENYLQETGDPVLNFSSVYAPTVNEDATGFPTFKVGIAKINRPFLLKVESDKKVEVLVSGYTNRQLRLNSDIFLVGSWQGEKILPCMISDRTKSRLGITEIAGLPAIAIMLIFSIDITLYFGKIIWELC